MWRGHSINPDRQYILQLCQDQNRARYIRPRETTSAPSAEMLLETVPIDGNLIASYKFDEICRALLTTGERFTIGPHGEWFTVAELQAIESVGWNAVAWVGGARPTLPSR